MTVRWQERGWKLTLEGAQLRIHDFLRDHEINRLVFSIVVLAILIPVALTGVISITMTVVAYEGAELLAVANGLRALRSGRDHLPIASEST